MGSLKQLTQRTTKTMTVQAVSDYIKTNKAQICESLPENISFEKMRSLAMSIIRSKPELQKCALASFLKAMLQATHLGLSPDQFLGHIYFVPVGQQVTAILGYRGLLELIHRSGKIQEIHSHLVYEGDTFLCEYGTNQRLQHLPTFDKKNRGKVQHVYAMAKLISKGILIEVMSYDEIEEIKQFSKASNSPAWKNHWGEMARKTVLKRLAKYLPMSIKVQQYIARDNEIEYPSLNNRQDSSEHIAQITAEKAIDITENLPNYERREPNRCQEK